MLFKSKLSAFTLLECLVALVVISGSFLGYNGLTHSLMSHMRYLSKNTENDWLVFAQQLQVECEGAEFETLQNDYLYLTKGKQKLSFGLSKQGDFRKMDNHGKGYQPMVFGVQACHMKMTERQLTISLMFEYGLKRKFSYVFEETS